MAQLATCLYARLDPADDDDGRRRSARLYWSNAGHLPPVVLDPTGRARLLDGAVGVPIGVPGPARREHESVSLAQGSTVLLYTDGLVETRDGDIDVGLAQLVERVAAHDAADGPQALVDRLLAARTDLTDDVALLAVQLL
jgi:serine phosphatase RsbU (regulator of sigma subunit)